MESKGVYRQEECMNWRVKRRKLTIIMPGNGDAMYKMTVSDLSDASPPLSITENHDHDVPSRQESVSKEDE